MTMHFNKDGSLTLPTAPTTATTQKTVLTLEMMENELFIPTVTSPLATNVPTRGEAITAMNTGNFPFDTDVEFYIEGTDGKFRALVSYEANGDTDETGTNYMFHVKPIYSAGAGCNDDAVYVKVDGTSLMKVGYTPTHSLHVATKEFVEAQQTAQVTGVLKIDGSLDMALSYAPQNPTSVATKGFVENTTLSKIEVHEIIRGYDVTIHMPTAGNKPTHAEALQGFKALPNYDFANDDKFYIMSDTKDKMTFVKYLSNGSVDETSTTYQFWIEELSLAQGSPSHVPIAVLESFTVEEADRESITVSIVGEDLTIGSNSQPQELLHWKINQGAYNYIPRSISYVGGNVILESLYGFDTGDAITVSYDGLGTTTANVSGLLHAFSPQPVINNITSTGITFVEAKTFAGSMYEHTVFVEFSDDIVDVNSNQGWSLKNIDTGTVYTISASVSSAKTVQLSVIEVLEAGNITLEYDGGGRLQSNADTTNLKPIPLVVIVNGII